LSDARTSPAASRLTAPQPIERLEAIRILAPLAILGFLASRFVHVAYWLTDVGFVVPERTVADFRQPLYIPPISPWLAYIVAIATIVSGLCTSIGFRTRIASGVFAALLAYLALADRLEAFTVNKLGTVIAIALFARPWGTRYGVDAWLRWKAKSDARPPTHVHWGNVRFFQALLVFMYLASGIAKAKGDWISDPNVIWSHLHDSYQTSFTHFLATAAPPVVLTMFQYLTLAYELGAPLWFGVRPLRPVGLALGLGMHTAIGVMFGPVIWFALLMMVLVVASFGPVAWLARPLERAWAKITESAEASSPSLSKAARE
jgi:hypothetical protein